MSKLIPYPKILTIVKPAKIIIPTNIFFATFFSLKKIAPNTIVKKTLDDKIAETYPALPCSKAENLSQVYAATTKPIKENGAIFTLIWPNDFLAFSRAINNNEIETKK